MRYYYHTVILKIPFYVPWLRQHYLKSPTKYPHSDSSSQSWCGCNTVMLSQNGHGNAICPCGCMKHEVSRSSVEVKMARTLNKHVNEAEQ